MDVTKQCEFKRVRCCTTQCHGSADCTSYLAEHLYSLQTPADSNSLGEGGDSCRQLAAVIKLSLQPLQSAAPSSCSVVTTNTCIRTQNEGCILYRN